MRKVILSIMLSLDGFIEDANGGLDWATSDEEIDQEALDLFNRVDAILLGKVIYQMFSDYWPSKTVDEEKVADKMNTLPKFVFSKTLEKVAWGTWDNAHLVKGDLVEEVSKLKQASGKDMVLFGGADIAQSFMQHSLIDEYRLIVYPIVLGSGKQLFKEGEQPISLTLLTTKTHRSGVVVLNYQVAR